MSHVPYIKKNYSNDNPYSQRIIIPKGSINPNQTTIIEIPERCENMSTIFAGSVEKSLSSSSIPNSIDEESQYAEPRNFRRVRNYPYYSRPHQRNTYETIEEDEYEDTSAHDLRSHSATDVNESKSNYYQNDVGEPQNQYEEESNRYSKRPHIDQFINRNYYVPRVRQHQNVQQAVQRTPEVRQYRNPLFYKIAQQSKCKNQRINKVLDKLDAVELKGLEQDLKNFQIARRKLLADVSSMKMF